MGLALAHLAAGTAFGKPTTLPWGIDLWNAKRHPTQIYELIVSLLIFGILWFRKNGYPGGSEFLLFTALTAGARLFLETFRGDSILVFGGVRLAQVIAWILLGAALIANEALRGEQKVV
jgi:phosphatidylglycerol:prolipoprotein diacylglycerol transferase